MDKKRFTLYKQVANFESLKQTMANKPLMIHISCHGDSYFDMNERRN